MISPDGWNLPSAHHARVHVIDLELCVFFQIVTVEIELGICVMLCLERGQERDDAAPDSYFIAVGLGHPRWFKLDLNEQLKDLLCVLRDLVKLLASSHD